MNEKLADRLADIRAMVQSIDERLANGNVPQGDLQGLKNEVDELRLRMWASMSAASSGDPGAIARFRLRRATQMLRLMGEELHDGALPADAPETEALMSQAERLVTEHRRHPRS